MRKLIAFPCAGETLVGTLDRADGATGLLIVSGGNEIRCGAHRGMAMLAASLASEGIPVFRFDRRGIGDSSGVNLGWAESAPDIAAAAATAAAETGLRHLVAFGNCDAATALACFHRAAGIDALVLANPWIGGTDEQMPAAAAIRALYAQRLRDPRQWLRALGGSVDFTKVYRGVRKLSASRSEESALVDRIVQGLTGYPATILLAERDNTAITFRAAWRKRARGATAAIRTLDSASHSFASTSDKAWLRDVLLTAIRTYSAA